ncbi:MAG: 2-oxoacid:acceptor oxidoreductase family protein [Succinivibrio sp.]|uniref:2-oxoacid:acceptor oxidoreductase family protein n=1 Tax=Succinivibrio faecicola TaxID=2820300 RepID=A0ABS7DDF8_9GAMM|nr:MULTISPECIES: 2-oxoacid:acceptor oxidoreductase family protein [Succinivibrio]MBW7569334.1 2-oxoacid:acceptor oxidoreductase family protein [Succinivibrio faecicola]MCI6939610.1 2-oxoacid:acceptor oxidoreductase family protein [Succinatimonas hippei]MDD6206856.1 2-oxoacid:acceptor oxidoreductase family protein [Succinivibrio sp.]
MLEFLWHGRGGQGAFTAARLLGAAYSLKNSNSYALAFPSFGPERRGAPIRSFTKLSDRFIGDRSEISKADYVVFLDDTLFSQSAFNELKEGGKIIVCTKNKIEDERVICIDGVSIALEILKLPITNTVILGAIAAVCDSVELEDLFNAVNQSMSAKLREVNCKVIQKAYDTIKERV